MDVGVGYPSSKLTFAVMLQHVAILVHDITYEGTYVSFWIELVSLLIWYMYIGSAAKNLEVPNVGLGSLS